MRLVALGNPPPELVLLPVSTCKHDSLARQCEEVVVTRLDLNDGLVFEALERDGCELRERRACCAVESKESFRGPEATPAPHLTRFTHSQRDTISRGDSDRPKVLVGLDKLDGHGLRLEDLGLDVWEVRRAAEGCVVVYSP